MFMKPVMAAVVLSLSASPLAAKQFCQPELGATWLSIRDIKKKVEAAGYKDFRIGLEYGCYEAEGSKNGIDLEVYVHPVTGKIVKVRKDLD
ncbi:PepSY domain-containing protein [Pacificimonas sp. WHA3]|uniref:PepSY domain-containing protein n=1 Tax=Pacificimonas pallii TaxID=2827236 RepID=A0ABS6SFK9_9SPHN|nr:PepSY domain-containing protein [Pacificimonas pallii]MBV7256637.1 PepSY domain-containing protein [Pacificimonas pallii]